MDDRSKTVLRAIRQILRATETHSKALLRASGLTPSQLDLAFGVDWQKNGFS